MTTLSTAFSPSALLANLHALDIKIWLEGDQLRLSAPKGALTPELRQAISEHKAEIMAFLQAALSAESTPILPIPAAPREQPLPLSFAQQRLWFLDQLQPGSSAYNIAFALQLNGRLEASALEASLSEIMRRHEILRTTFPSVDGIPFQMIAPVEPLALSIVDLRHLTQAEQQETAQRLAHEETERPFELAKGPLMRVRLLRVQETEHVLLLVVHHTIWDGWSTSVFLHELASLYSAFTVGKPSPLSPLPIQYVDHAVWQREQLQGESLKKLVSYWQRQLKGPLPVLQLSIEQQRRAIQTNQADFYHFKISPSLLAALKALGKSERATLFMVLLAAFQTLLYRYSGQEDILVGSPIAGRTHPDTEGLIGFFVNTLLLRSDLSGEPTFRQFLHRVREVALAAYAHQDLPFERLVEAIHPERNLEHTDIFQVMFILQNTPRTTSRLPDLNVRPREVQTKNAKFPLTLELDEEPDGLWGKLEYSTDLFSQAAIIRLIGHFQTLLEGIVRDPDQRITTLPLLTEPEREQLLVTWNATAAEYPQDAQIQELFEAQVERTPDAIAVVFENQQITYRQLNRQANQLARTLRLLGVGSGSEDTPLVGICVERSLQMIVGLLAILKAGGAYVPLDPSYPAERLAFMLLDSRASVLLTQQHLLTRFPEHQAKVVLLDGDRTAVEQESGDNLNIRSAADQPAYAIYTSGSTGKPKGVLGLHRAAINRFYWMWQTYPFEPGEVCCQKTALSFVDAVWEVFGPLLKGVKTVIIPDEVVKDPARLIDALASNQVSRIVLVPSLLQALLYTYTDLQSRLPRLRYWISSGEALSLDLWQRFAQLMPKSILLNLYGSSEVAADATYYDLGNSQPVSSVPIGRPISNIQTYILDRHLQPLPIGVQGELYIGGAGLAGGYLDRPELTQERFIPNPFSAEANARLYKTGDLARYLPDGNIEYLGRLDYQVKIRGRRIELGEIESVLKQHPSIAQVAVITWADKSGDKRLVAYVVASSGAGYQLDELRSFLKERLPDYMVPATFVLLDTMPLTPNGKVDRKALPPPDQVGILTEKGFVAPRNPLEVQLTQVWQRVMGIQPIGVTDNFFDIGGHSLMAVRLFAEIEKEFGVKLPLATLFQTPTIAQLVPLLTPQNGPQVWPSLVPIRTDGDKRPLFCVHPLCGDVFAFGVWARYLGSDQPFYGLRGRGMDNILMPDEDIKVLAGHYIDEIRSVQDRGPYYLSGYGTGSIVAFEMAQQLKAQGEEIALLVLMNQPAPDWDYYQVKLSPRFLVSFLKNLPYWLAETLKQRSLRQSIRILEWFKTYREQREVVASASCAQPLKRSYRELIHPDEDPEQVPEGRRNFMEAHYIALLQYKPHRYPGRVTVFRTNRQPLFCSFDPQLGWGKFSEGGVKTILLPGSNRTILKEPHGRVVGEQLRRCLEETQHKSP